MASVQSKPVAHMTIAAQDLEYIKSQVFIWLKEADAIPNSSQLTERMIRVEESIKNQMQLMQQGFEQNDKHIQLLREEMNRRFEQVDKRFEQVDKRFEQVDKRFEQVDKRFEQVDKRFDKMMVNFRWAIGAMIAFWGVALGTIQFMS